MALSNTKLANDTVINHKYKIDGSINPGGLTDKNNSE